jgi:hypothetical protein
MYVRVFPLLILSLYLVGADCVLAQQMRPGEGEQFAPPVPPASRGLEEGGEKNLPPRFRRRPGIRGLPGNREERQRRLERARVLAQRLLDDPSTPDEVKTKARRLTDLLSQRETLERSLEGQRQNFLQEHSQDLEELRQLRERSEVIRQRLRAARERALAENLPTLQEMRRTTQEARDLAIDLRQYYRPGRGNRRPGTLDER